MENININIGNDDISYMDSINSDNKSISDLAATPPQEPIVCINISETTNKILLYSSCIFITNIISAYYKQDYIYATAFVALTTTSLIYHYNSNIYNNIIDKTAILSIVFYGLYRLRSKTAGGVNNIVLGFVFFTFFLTIYLYGYGYLTNNYCFHPTTGNYYHACLHIISSIGHHIIIFM